MWLDKKDVALAHFATSYACENWYSMKAISEKVYGYSPLVISSHKNADSFPFTKAVLKGIRRMRSQNVPVGVVLGKDILELFNAPLNTEEFYEDLLLHTFDLICTTCICRTGELAPVLSDPSKVAYIVTLKGLKIGESA